MTDDDLEEAARVCDGVAEESFREARENAFLTDAGRSAYTSKAVGAEECAMALRARKRPPENVIPLRRPNS